MRTFLALAASLVPVFLAPQPEKAPPASTPARTAPPGTEFSAALKSRLESLTLDRPMDYFLLGEDVAAEEPTPENRTLARQLFVLAYQLGARSPAGHEGHNLGASVCLALASIATRDDERRWLRALADTLSDAATTGPTPNGNDASLPQETAFDLATAMGLARSGDGRRAEQLLDKPGVAELLDRFDSLPMPDGTIGGLRNFLKRAIRDWPVCPQCRNRRVVPAGPTRSGEMVLCDTCRGNPGPKLTEAELANQLRIEAVLLQGTQRSWAAQVLADAGAPLRDLDPSELVGTYGVDPQKPLWRAGIWVAATQPATPSGEGDSKP